MQKPMKNQKIVVMWKFILHFSNADLVDQLYPWKGSKASMFEDVELLTEELK